MAFQSLSTTITTCVEILFHKVLLCAKAENILWIVKKMSKIIHKPIILVELLLAIFFKDGKISLRKNFYFDYD